jgi:nucleoside 2-deoxyribosyltransferase
VGGGTVPQMSAKPRCYVASALGFTEAGRHYYEHVYLPALATVVEPVDPWALTTAAEVEAARVAGDERAMALEIGRRNAVAIRTCTVLVAHLDGQEPDAGTVAELGYAAALGLRCHGLRTDFRDSGERGVRVNLQIEAFVAESGGVIVGDLAALAATLAA